METMSRRDLDVLLDANTPHCVSLYMPTHRTGGPESRENSTRFNNLIRQTSEKLQAAGCKGLKQQAIVKSLEELRHDSIFWQNQAEGLAIFFDGDARQAFRLPLQFQERCVVGPRFLVRPLLPLFQGDGRFYVLAVSQNKVRLLEGTRYSINEIHDDRLPKNLAEALDIDEYMESLQFTSMRGASISSPSGRGQAVFHGQGGSNMDVKKSDELLPYFRKIDQALQELVGVEHNPLVFAGVEYLFPLFKEASQYNGLVEEPITGSPDALKPGDLHAKAWPLVASRFDRLRESELERLRTQADPRPHSTDLAEIISAARVGAVDSLFLADSQNIAGRYEVDEPSGEVRIFDDGEGEQEDLLNVAAIETLRNGGKVFTIENDRVPDGQAAAARFRWALKATAK